ncbi:hypothetical protein ACFCWB_07020 [Streptomyces bacillaris]|uniref:hypothetical protein n=1 Tax=Streptomyces bacillaris TaxID=68179 RepID=UPI0035D9A2BD
MTESNTSSSASAAAPNKGVKQGLPFVGLPAAEDAAVKLWGVARLGTVSPEAFARQFGEKIKASGSGWDRRLAMLRGFKLVRAEGRQLGLSELGQKIVNSSDPVAQLEARREAIMSLKAYRELVESFNRTALPDPPILATKLQFEYGKTEKFAARAAQSFIESLKHAEMIDPGNIVCKEGVVNAASIVSLVPASEAVEESDQNGDQEDAAEIDRAFEGEASIAEPSEVGPALVERNVKSGKVPNLSLSLTLDLSNFRADEVVRILGVLGFDGRD